MPVLQQEVFQETRRFQRTTIIQLLPVLRVEDGAELMDECLVKSFYLERTGETLECDKCIFKGTEQCDEREKLLATA